MDSFLITIPCVCIITYSGTVKITTDSIPRALYRAAHTRANSSDVVIFHLSKQVTILSPRYRFMGPPCARVNQSNTCSSWQQPVTVTRSNESWNKLAGTWDIVDGARIAETPQWRRVLFVSCHCLKINVFSRRPSEKSLSRI